MNFPNPSGFGQLVQGFGKHRLRAKAVHIARGRLVVNGTPLEAGDALKASAVTDIVLEKGEGAEVLLFDLT